MRCPGLQPLPAHLENHAAVVVFGGPMSANDSETLPSIRTELDWLPMVLASGKPYLGICLGAQLLARALGARVAPHPEGLREIGYFRIQPTPEGRAQIPLPMQVYHWHQEGFELPTGAVLLATGETFANQAFRYGQNAYGLQFHPEMTQTIMERWTATAPEQLSLPGAQSRTEQLQKHALYGPLLKTWLQGFLEHWLHQRAEPQLVIESN
ncbi:glutamine amidotransferase [Leptolyngbya sp. FACHB-261]|nr:glutamine amidotransferase [Leptolyngbya sp. FACHB-261]